jgi:GntR family transcriptional regulator
MTQPKRDQIADALRQAISDGTYGQGDRLPNLDEIQATYGVSRGTAMDALDQLEAAGLIERRPGRSGGNFVRVHRVVDVFTWRDDQPRGTGSEKDLFFRTVLEQGYEPSQDFSAQEAPMPAEFAALLHVPTGDPASLRRCLRYVDGVPHSIQDSWYPAWLCDRVPELRSAENIPQGTTKLLEDEGFIQGAAIVFTTGRPPAADEAALLGIPLVGNAILRTVLVGYTDDGPLRISTAVLAADKTRLVAAHGDLDLIARFWP